MYSQNNEGIKNLSPYFHDMYHELCREKLYVGEEAIYSTDCSASNGRAGFIILTNRRYLLRWVSYGSGIIYYGNPPKRGVSKLLFGDGGERRRWADNARGVASLLSNRSPNIFEDDYTKIRGIVAHEYLAVSDTKTIKLLELHIDYKATRSAWRFAFRVADGRSVQEYLTTAMQNGGVIPANDELQGQPKQHNALKLLDYLGELHKAGVITDIEFKEKKKQLLARI